MMPHWNSDIPIVAIYNNIETFFDFLNRTDDLEIIEKRQYRGDRALLWLGARKLVFVTSPIPYAEQVCRRLGYHGTRCLSPVSHSPWLSLDILREPALLMEIVKHAGAERTIQLIPYATTRQFFQLAETLRTEYQLNVLLPESPLPECLWLRDYIDTKAGFRALAARWLPDPTLLPEGVVCQDLRQAAEVAYWFNRWGKACVVKANRGESGLGHTLVQPEDFASVEAIQAELQQNAFLHDDLIIVEEFIQSSASLSTSLELFVPPLGAGEPEITYLSKQLFLEFGNCSGVLVSRELLNAPWYSTLAESGLRIAARLQAMGYVGHFDLDVIVDDADHVFLLEVNSRRTGGTHVHEFAKFFFGPDYLDKVAVVGYNKMSSGPITHLEELSERLKDLLYPISSEPRGVIITATSGLAVHEFGCIIVAATTEAALALQHRLVERIRSLSRQASELTYQLA